jgi:uncharacterized protein
MPTSESGQVAEQSLFAALDALTRGDTKPWSEMFHADGVMEFPYAPPGFPQRLDGQEAIRAYMVNYPDNVRVERVEPAAVHHADDAMVVEFDLQIVAVKTGNRVRMRYVGILTHADGKLRRYRDYWDPLVALQAMGGAAALLDMGGKEQPA